MKLSKTLMAAGLAAFALPALAQQLAPVPPVRPEPPPTIKPKKK